MHNLCGCGLFFNFYRKAEDHTRSQKCAVLLLVVASTCKPTSKSGGVVSKKKYEATSKCSETPHCSETPAPTLLWQRRLCLLFYLDSWAWNRVTWLSVFNKGSFARFVRLWLTFGLALSGHLTCAGLRHQRVTARRVHVGGGKIPCFWSSHTHGEMGSLPGACCRQSSAGVRPVL